MLFIDVTVMDQYIPINNIIWKIPADIIRMDCKFIKRGWAGYFIDVVTMGGFTTYRTFEFSKCIQEQQKMTLEEFEKIYKLTNGNHIQLQKHLQNYHKHL
jgi:hypothetical protein